jgi:hypothetical protein
LSEDLNADLIVMASNRTPSLTRRLLRSITRKVIDSVEKPVLVVHKWELNFIKDFYFDKYHPMKRREQTIFSFYAYC